MRIKALRVIAGAYGVLTEGQEANVSAAAGKALVDAGLAVEVGESSGPEADAEPEVVQRATVKANKKVKGE